MFATNIHGWQFSLVKCDSRIKCKFATPNKDKTKLYNFNSFLSVLFWISVFFSLLLMRRLLLLSSSTSSSSLHQVTEHLSTYFKCQIHIFRYSFRKKSFFGLWNLSISSTRYAEFRSSVGIILVKSHYSLITLPRCNRILKGGRKLKQHA